MTDLLKVAQAISLLWPVIEQIKDMFDGDEEAVKGVIAATVDEKMPVPEPVVTRTRWVAHDGTKLGTTERTATRDERRMLASATAREKRTVPTRDNSSQVDGAKVLEVDWDGPGGWLYKPSGDHSGKAVILSPANEDFSRVVLVNATTGKDYETRYTGRANGDRQHWRVDISTKELREKLGRGGLEIRAYGTTHTAVLRLRGLRERVD